MEKTYSSYLEWAEPSRQTEVTAETPLLAEDGTLIARGWARHNVFQYDRNRVRHVMRRKEWDFYQISDGLRMLQLSFANISLGGYASAVLVDLKAGKTLASDMAPFVGGKDRYVGVCERAIEFAGQSSISALHWCPPARFLMVGRQR